MKSPSLTPKQLQVLKFVLAYREKNGISPTLDEIGEQMDVNRVTILFHIKEMEKKGVLRRSQRLSRSIEPLISPETQSSWIPPIPILGQIAAGRPIEAVEDRESFDFRDLVPPNGDIFMLRVKGQSMVEDGIHDGDYVIVEKKSDAYNGQTVVALIDGSEATLKKFYREEGRVRLQPSNSTMAPIYVQAGQNLQIQGVVIGLVRKV